LCNSSTDDGEDASLMATEILLKHTDSVVSNVKLNLDMLKPTQATPIKATSPCERKTKFARSAECLTKPSNLSKRICKVPKISENSKIKVSSASQPVKDAKRI
jgi:hypothetical protein